jgi:hypothetical protein
MRTSIFGTNYEIYYFQHPPFLNNLPLSIKCSPHHSVLKFYLISETKFPAHKINFVKKEKKIRKVIVMCKIFVRD